MKHVHSHFEARKDEFQCFGSFTTIPKELEITGYPQFDIVSVRYWVVKTERVGTFILPEAKEIYLGFFDNSWKIGIIENQIFQSISNDEFYDWLKDVILNRLEEVSK